MEDRSGSVTMEILLRNHSSIGDLPAAELITVAAWYIWWQRRQFVKGETISDAHHSAISIKVLAMNYVRAATPNQLVRKRDQMWKKPTRGKVKINVDASFHEDILSGATGAIARDDTGQFLAAASWVLPHINSAVSLEILAIRNGLYLAAHIGCSKVIVESDSQLALEAVEKFESYLGQEAAIVMECNELKANYASVSFDNCTREANAIADCLAKSSFNSKSSSMWDATPPDFISQLIVTDLAII
ncbi:hypothetical protein ACQJBY_042149 [Aegilops geniculata]